MQSELLALGSAVMLALGSLFVVELKGRIDAQSVARWTMLLAGTMTGAAAVVDGGWATVGQDTLVYLAISGFFAISSSSRMSFAGNDGCATTMLVMFVTWPIGSKSLVGSYFSFG